MESSHPPFPFDQQGLVALYGLSTKDAAGVADLSFESPALALICARRRLGDGSAGGAAAGGAFVEGPIQIDDASLHTLASLAFELRGARRCAVFASAWASNPGGGTLDNAYRFRLARENGVSSWDQILEFDDNGGVDDAGALPIATTHVFGIRSANCVVT